MPDTACIIANETLHLLPERAIWWPRMGALLIADTHWGKAATFRAAGIALPGGTTSSDLARLDAALDRTQATQLVILGDLLHARTGRAPRTLSAISAWRTRRAALPITLVRGNHDKGAGDPPAEWEFAVVDEPLLHGPFALRHMPLPTPDRYTLAGHLHPGIGLVGIGKLACFWMGAEVGVLPAFSSFTGLGHITPAPTDGVYVVADDEVIAVQQAR